MSVKISRGSSANKAERHLIGLISDTHGLLRPQALSALAGVDLIIHAGDIGRPEVLEALNAVAPVVAIKGNVDKGEWAKSLPDQETITVGQVRIYVIHNVKELDFNPPEEGYAVVISGHSHMPSIITRDGVLFVNPGSAGPRRFKLPVALAKLHIDGGNVRARLVYLQV